MKPPDRFYVHFDYQDPHYKRFKFDQEQAEKEAIEKCKETFTPRVVLGLVSWLEPRIELHRLPVDEPPDLTHRELSEAESDQLCRGVSEAQGRKT